MSGLSRILSVVKFAAKWATSPSVRKNDRSAVYIAAILSSAADRKSIRDLAANAGWNLQMAPSIAETAWLNTRPGRLILIYDSELARTDWRDVITTATSTGDSTCVLLASPFLDQRLWSEVIRLGGRDVVRKPIDKDELRQAINFALTWQKWWSRDKEPETHSSNIR